MAELLQSVPTPSSIGSQKPQPTNIEDNCTLTQTCVPSPTLCDMEPTKLPSSGLPELSPTSSPENIHDSSKYPVIERQLDQAVPVSATAKVPKIRIAQSDGPLCNCLRSGQGIRQLQDCDVVDHALLQRSAASREAGSIVDWKRQWYAHWLSDGTAESSRGFTSTGGSPVLPHSPL